MASQRNAQGRATVGATSSQCPRPMLLGSALVLVLYTHRHTFSPHAMYCHDGLTHIRTHMGAAPVTGHPSGKESYACRVLVSLQRT